MSYLNETKLGIDVSTLNSTSTPLLSGGTYTGTGEEAKRSAVVVAVKTDQAGTLYADFSVDNSNWDSTLTYDVAASTNEVHKLTVTRKYFRVRFVNLGGDQTYFRLQTMFGEFDPLTSVLSSNIQADADGLVTRSILVGQAGNGRFINSPVTSEGHLEVEVHGPRLPFGSIHAESLTPVIQKDAVYGLNVSEINYGSTGSGGVTNGNSKFTVSTGTTIYSQGYLQSRKRLRYRPGQGVVGRFTSLYTGCEGISGSYAVAGFGQSEDGVYFGYKNGVFGILHSSHGTREQQTLTVTTGATSASNVTITLNGTAYNVPVTASSNIQRTVYEIATYASYVGWQAQAVGATVVFLANDAGDKTNTFSFGAGSTGAAASFAETVAGVSSTEDFYPQTSWNVDVFDGSNSASNPSGVLLDPTQGNVYQINIQYLGFGAIVFQIEVCEDGNNPVFETCHIIQYPNNNTTPSLGNPSFGFTMAAYSAGSTTDISVSSSSFAGLIEGQKVLRGPRFTYRNALATTVTTTLYSLFTIKNSLVYNGRTNQSVINILGFSAGYEATKAGEFVLVRNATLAGNPNFASYATGSCSLYDTSGTTVTVSDNSQYLYSIPFATNGQLTIQFEGDEVIELQPGESISLCAVTRTGTASYVNGSINTREDQ